MKDISKETALQYEGLLLGLEVDNKVFMIQFWLDKIKNRLGLSSFMQAFWPFTAMNGGKTISILSNLEVVGGLNVSSVLSSQET